MSSSRAWCSVCDREGGPLCKLSGCSFNRDKGSPIVSESNKLLEALQRIQDLLVEIRNNQ